uniref:Putative poly(ADP-ribose) polymerase, catalytic domain, zinc finger, C2H2-like protein n=1 Tax=Tanacetum cinerariifolium TaxID=118510 RepID=A0A6L2P138_TANCI|nr:putative poly(ADP-ribose) polymerase, catalytic domain, zinc finger, C2H2-like protein [Tanacetum cinerariifolium]
MASNVEVNIRGLLELCKRALAWMNIWVSSAPLEWTPTTELMTPDQTYPSTHQLLRSSSGYSGPNMSFDMPASLEYLSGLARASLAEVFKLHFFSDSSEGDYTSPGEANSEASPQPEVYGLLSSCLLHYFFYKPGLLEQHQAFKHAVSELFDDEPGKNIVRIIFQTGWPHDNVKNPMIYRVMKIHNSPKILTRFEEYREAVKAKAARYGRRRDESGADLHIHHWDERCIADGNEHLRFHCATFLCDLGQNGNSSICSHQYCSVCGIIRVGFSTKMDGISTFSTSYKGHLALPEDIEEEFRFMHVKRAMLVCRVIAGRVGCGPEIGDKDDPGYDSLVGRETCATQTRLDDEFGVQTRRMIVTTDEQWFITVIYEEKTHEDIHTCLLDCFLSQEEPKRIINALKDPAWVEAMQEELLQFHLQKVEKALYGLHQAPRAWYETLAKYLLDNGLHKGKIDQTLFIKRQKEDILLVQVYVDDIIFGFTKKELCIEFKELMHDKFQMSSIGELAFFLGLQVKQKSAGIFINQDKYVDEILRKFKYANVKPTKTPMDKEKALLKDSDGDDVDFYLCRKNDL